jgi:hypothetical protein
VYALGGLGLERFILISPGLADTIRVTTWNLEPRGATGVTNTTADTDQFPIEDAAAALKELNPDVLLLQQVRDSKMCDQIAQALKPADYKVLPRSGRVRSGSRRMPRWSVNCSSRSDRSGSG